MTDDLKAYRCTVTLLVEDMEEATIKRFIRAGEEVEWANPEQSGHLAIIEYVEYVEVADDAL